MSIFSINNVSFNGSENILIKNGVVFVDGKDVSDKVKGLNISIVGNVEKVEVNYCEKISITGDVKDVNTQSGDIDVKGQVKGSVKTQSGDVECEDVAGNVSTMAGDIECGNVKGNVSTMSGDIIK